MTYPLGTLPFGHAWRDPRTMSGRQALYREVTGHHVDRLIIDDPHQAYPLLDPDVDLSGILATRAVLADFDEQFCDGSGDSAVRAALVSQLVDEVMPLARTDEQRHAVQMMPRPGLWLGSDLADGRELTQTQTDAMVRFELWRTVGLGSDDAHRRVRDAVGEPMVIELEIAAVGATNPKFAKALTRAVSQRAGIDSDPLVRLLAYRTWGERDVMWPTRAVGKFTEYLERSTLRFTPYREGDLLRAAEETLKAVSVGYAEPREGMVRSSTRREKRPPPVPKWAKDKRSRTGRPVR